MPRTISMTFPHEFGTEVAKQRIATRFEAAKKEYVDKLGKADMTWVGDTAHLNIAALGQSMTATIEVMPTDVKIEVQLPWLLSAMAGKIQSLMQKNAEKVLLAGPGKKV